MRTFKLLSYAVLISSLSTAVLANTGAVRPDQAKPSQPLKDKPNIILPEKANGQRAVQLLQASGKLADFAQFYGFDLESAETLFIQDPTAYVDETGSLLYVEPAAVEPEQAIVAPNTGANQLNIPLDQTFFLESKPGSTRTLYLDFDGSVTTGTAWNQSYGVSSIVHPPYDLDGNPNTFSTTELQQIQQIWKLVSEDFSAFDINVTTRDLGVDAIVRSSSTDNTFGSHVVMTRNFTNDLNRPCGCGGFAYLSVFDAQGSFYKPAFVFNQGLKGAAEAASHEAGHNLGLNHDGTSSSAYYGGHGTGATGWAPIMGVGYSKNLVQWSKGEYSAANNREDDYLVMQNNSLYFDADDYGNTLSTAELLQSSLQNGFLTYALQGTLQGPNDSDLFLITAGAGELKVDVNPFHLSPNVDVLLTLLNENGQALASANPIDLLAASLTFNIPLAGQYFLRVEGAGKGDPLLGGYTQYGSIGIYTVAVQAQPGTGGPNQPLARITTSAVGGVAPFAVDFNGSGSVDLDGDISSYSWDFGNGQSATGALVRYTYPVAGTFVATLTVTDATGLSDSESVTITVNEPQPLLKIGVNTITMAGLARKARGKNPAEYRADALVLVTNEAGQCIANVLVKVEWTGVVTGSGQALTSCAAGTTSVKASNGKGSNPQMSGNGALVRSPISPSPGTFNVRVIAAELQGAEFVPSTNDQKSIQVQ